MPTTAPVTGTNLSILVGALRSPAEVRTLRSGDDVLTLELVVRPPGRPAESVPLRWPAAPAPARTWAAGEELLVVGRVRRRFYRAGGGTQSRTEVEVDIAVPLRRRAAARSALEAAVAGLPSRL